MHILAAGHVRSAQLHGRTAFSIMPSLVPAQKEPGTYLCRGCLDMAGQSVAEQVLGTATSTVTFGHRHSR